MNEANTKTLERIYHHLSEGNYPALLDACSDQITLQIPGKSRLAGKYSKATLIQDFFLKEKELSGGTFKFQVHDILANAQHATVLASAQITRDGKTLEYRTVHVWRFDAEKPLAWYEYPRDLYHFDQIWS